jgi:hypothetical protein
MTNKSGDLRMADKTFNLSAFGSESTSSCAVVDRAFVGADPEEILGDAADGISELSASDAWEGKAVIESEPIAAPVWQAPSDEPSDSRGSLATLEERFGKLVARWKQESTFMSSPMDMIALPSYLAIIGLGKEVVPLLLRELNRETDQWFFALAVLTGNNPAAGAEAGDIGAMAQAWLAWGRTLGLI